MHRSITRRTLLNKAFVAGGATLAVGAGLGAAAALATPTVPVEPSLASAARAEAQVQEIVEKLRLLRRRDPRVADAVVQQIHAILDEALRLARARKAVVS